MTGGANEREAAMKKTLALAVLMAAMGCSSSSDDGPGDSYEPNDTPENATPISINTTVSAAINPEDDFDAYRITLGATTTLNIWTAERDGSGCASPIDTYVEIWTTGMSFVTDSDDSGLNFCEDFDVTLGAGSYYVVVSGYGGEWGYSLGIYSY
jgi:hypothetical protein